jgi:LacI family repressor for deo operon, udp, cdd, tsx, nupC, and nupG
VATIRDVAAEAGVSRATVTRALHEPDKVSPKRLAKVQAAIQKLGYRPNMLSQTFRASSTRNLVVLAPNLANPFFAKVIAGIDAAADERDYKILVGGTHGSQKRESEFVKMVETRLADGILQLSPYLNGGDNLLPRAHVPAVSVAGVPDTPYASMRIDNIAAVKECIRHLVALGHRQIGVITGPVDNCNTILRLQGYKAGLREAGIRFNPELVKVGNFRLNSGLEAVAEFALKRNDVRPTAIFCMNDEMAIGAIKALASLRLNVPGDVSVIGFDNLDFASFSTPALTTVEQPGHEMGYRSAHLLMDIIENTAPSDTADTILPYRFIVRESTGPVLRQEDSN